MSHLAASLSPLNIHTVAIFPSDELELLALSVTLSSGEDGWRARLAEEWAQDCPSIKEVIFPDGSTATREDGGPWVVE